MHCTDNHSQHSSITGPVWLNGWVLVYELSGCGFESCCSQVIDLLINDETVLLACKMKGKQKIANCLL